MCINEADRRDSEPEGTSCASLRLTEEMVNLRAHHVHQ
jgi:hypothetical protein